MAAEIGNYGVASADGITCAASRRFIIRDESPVASNWRAQERRDYLVANNIVAIRTSIRALTRRLVVRGCDAWVIATGSQIDEKALVDRAQSIPKMEGSDLVRVVTSQSAFDHTPEAPDQYDIQKAVRATRRLKIAAATTSA